MNKGLPLLVLQEELFKTDGAIHYNYSAYRRRGGVLNSPRFCFFFITPPAVGEAEF